MVEHKRDKGKLLYKIRWVGFDEGSDTWEPASNMLGTKAKALVEKYWQEQATSKREHDGSEIAVVENLRCHWTIRLQEEYEEAPAVTKELSQTPEGSVTEKSKRPRRSTHFYEYQDEEVEEAAWFGIDPELAQSKQVNRELRNLYVADRVPTWTEKVHPEALSSSEPTRNLQILGESDVGVRVTRTQLRTARGKTNASPAPSSTASGPTGTRTNHETLSRFTV